MKEVIWFKFNDINAVNEFMNKFNVPNTLISLQVDRKDYAWELLFWDVRTEEMHTFANQLFEKYSK
jgi:hypothetical protein